MLFSRGAAASLTLTESWLIIGTDRAAPIGASCSRAPHWRTKTSSSIARCCSSEGGGSSRQGRGRASASKRRRRRLGDRVQRFAASACMRAPRATLFRRRTLASSSIWVSILVPSRAIYVAYILLLPHPLAEEEPTARTHPCRAARNLCCASRVSKRSVPPCSSRSTRSTRPVRGSNSASHPCSRRDRIAADSERALSS